MIILLWQTDKPIWIWI